MPCVFGGMGNQKRGTEMKKRLLMSTAVLLASIALASAQNMQGQGGQSGAMQKQESPGGSAQSQGRGGEMGKGESQRSQGAREQTTGQREQGESKQGQQRGQGQTTGQGQRDEGKGSKQGQAQ